MPSHAEVAAKLLRDAAGFFQTVGEQNPSLKAQMDENANVFSQVAGLVESDPTGELQTGEAPAGREDSGGGA
jgi:hypothetical protein